MTLHRIAFHVLLAPMPLILVPPSAIYARQVKLWWAKVAAHALIAWLDFLHPHMRKVINATSAEQDSTLYKLAAASATCAPVDSNPVVQTCASSVKQERTIVTAAAMTVPSVRRIGIK
jgi:hypothetical protein